MTVLAACKVLNSWYWSRLSRADQVRVCSVLYREGGWDLWVFTNVTSNN